MASKKIGFPKMKKRCKHKWTPMPVAEFRGEDFHWHVEQKALCEKCAEVKMIEDRRIKDFI